MNLSFESKVALVTGAAGATATVQVVAYFVGGFAKVFPMAAGDNIDLKK